MNRNLLPDNFPLFKHIPKPVAAISETWAEIAIGLYQKKLPRYLFLALCFNLLLAPIVSAATVDLSRSQSWSLGLLAITAFALSIYLFVVMFAPEKF